MSGIDSKGKDPKEKNKDRKYNTSTAIETSIARENFADTLNRVSYGKERVLIHRRGKEVAALVPVEDLRSLEEMEDSKDSHGSGERENFRQENIPIEKDRDLSYLRKFNDELAAREGPLDLQKAMDIFSALWEEGTTLGSLPPDDPMEGVHVDIRIARILNSCSKSFSPS